MTRKDLYLLEACKQGKLTRVKRFIKKGANARVNNDEAVCWAARNGHFSVVEFLITKCEANPRTQDDYCLRWAANLEKLSIVQHLLQYYSSEDIPCNIKDSIIQSAVKGGRLCILKMFEEKGINVNGENYHSLRWACLYGHWNIVKFFVKEKTIHPRVCNDICMSWSIMNKNWNTVLYLSQFYSEDELDWFIQKDYSCGKEWTFFMDLLVHFSEDTKWLHSDANDDSSIGFTVLMFL